MASPHLKFLHCSATTVNLETGRAKLFQAFGYIETWTGISITLTMWDTTCRNTHLAYGCTVSSSTHPVVD